MRRSHWSVVLAAVLLAPSLASSSNGQTISNGSYSVGLDRMGLVTDPPAQGLISTYGPRVALTKGMTEWFAVAYDTPTGRVSAVGQGSVPDYAGRTPVQFVSARVTGSGAVFVGRVGDLEIEHTFSFCEVTQCLILGVSLRNTGSTPLKMVMYSREWQGLGLPSETFPAEWDRDLPPAPPNVWRLAWMPNDIRPGRTQGTVLVLDPQLFPPPTAAVDVPLQLWTNSTWPNGVDFGKCNGISFCDFNHDSFIDVYSNQSRDLWQNFAGADWGIANDLSPYYPGDSEYGSAWADYDNDQLPDFGSEPRGFCMALLHNEGNAVFEDVADDPNVVDVQPCDAHGETLCVADVDGDGNLDWFLPAYPPWILGSTGNWFLYNEGLDATLGEYTFREMSAAAGLDNPPFPVARPEGAEFCDYDHDGDVDLYSNNTIYRNLSTPGAALFEAMTETGSGVEFSDILEEGAGFLDYDMDGDMDLCIAFCDFAKGVRMFENDGDGTFTLQPMNLFDSPSTGLCLGLSHADWDNDGDVDVTTSEVFRRNQWIEIGARYFTVATHGIDFGHISDAMPAWGDFDKDGDLDSALGNFNDRGRLYDNTTYDSTTPDDQRRYVRFKVVRDSTIHDDGLETEFGAQVSLGFEADSNRRVAIVSTSGGYLNQNEYVLPFAVPADPDPSNPDVDLSFDASVDLKGSSVQGLARVDRHVNPILADIDFAELDQREILVYRSGRVVLDGRSYVPALPMTPLTTSTDGLVLPTFDAMAPDPSPSPAPDWFVGIEISTAGATKSQRIEEIVVDGRLAAAVACGSDVGDTFVWDVSTPGSPVLADGGVTDLDSRLRNVRNFMAADVTLKPNRTYRIVTRVNTYRPTPVLAPVVNGEIATNGGLFIQDVTPCTGAAVDTAAVDPLNVYLSIRFRNLPGGAWADFGSALAGTNGDPRLVGTGTLRGGDGVTLTLTNARANAPTYVILGLTESNLPVFGGVLVPSIDLVLPGLSTDASGSLTLSGTWPDGIPGGTRFFAQALVLDRLALRGVAFSNAVAGVASF